MIILKVFGREAAMVSKFNRDRAMTKNVDARESSMVLMCNGTVIYYLMNDNPKIKEFRPNLVELYGVGSMSNINREAVLDVIRN